MSRQETGNFLDQPCIYKKKISHWTHGDLKKIFYEYCNDFQVFFEVFFSVALRASDESIQRKYSRSYNGKNYVIIFNINIWRHKMDAQKVWGIWSHWRQKLFVFQRLCGCFHSQHTLILQLEIFGIFKRRKCNILTLFWSVYFKTQYRKVCLFFLQDCKVSCA